MIVTMTYSAYILLLALASLTPLSVGASSFDPSLKVYPQTRRADTTFTYQSAAQGQVSVLDAYSWLEDSPDSSQEVKQFVDQQKALTQTYIDACIDLGQVNQALMTVVDYPRFSAPRPQGSDDSPFYVYNYNPGLDGSPTVYKVDSRDELLAAEANLYATLPGSKFFDGNLLSSDGATFLEGLYYAPKTGAIAAYAVGTSGSDFFSVYFRETSKPFVNAVSDPVEAAKGGSDRLSDELHGVKFSGITWTQDEAGVFYQTFAQATSVDSQGTKADSSGQLYYHRLGTDQAEDVLVLARDPINLANIFDAQTTKDGKWLIATSSNGAGVSVRMWIAPLDTQPISSSMKWISVAPGYDFSLDYIANDDNVFYFMSNENAPNFKIVRAQFDSSTAKTITSYTGLTEKASFEDVVAEDKVAVLDYATVVNVNKLLLVYINNVKHEIYEHELATGKRVQRLLPDLIGTVRGVSGRRTDQDAFVSTVAFNSPTTIYRLTWDDKEGKDIVQLPGVAVHRSTILTHLDLTLFTTRQVFVAAEGGISIPVYIIGRSDVLDDGTAPAILYYYGSFGSTFLPFFSSTLLAWAASYKGLVVLITTRGGGEFGTAWFEAGSGLNKKNVISDVLTASNYLIDNKVAAKGKLILHGLGTISLAVANVAPEGLFGATSTSDTLTDLLRYTQFSEGVNWVPEFGDPSDPTYFDYLYSYSPLHNVDANKVYPFTYIQTQDVDERVPPLHSFKMIATMQYAVGKNDNPLLLRVISDKDQAESNVLFRDIKDVATEYCLIAQALDLVRTPL